MAGSKWLRTLFLEAAIEASKSGDDETASYLVRAVKAEDAAKKDRQGRTKGSTAASRASRQEEGGLK